MPQKNKESKSTQQIQNVRNVSGSSSVQKRKDCKEESNSTRKQRVFINRTSAPTKPQTNKSAFSQPQQQIQINSAANYFGAQIPEDVMENVLFRFLYNIPENEKNDHIRVCFHIELAHWFYLDFYCPDGTQPLVENCKKVGFSQFSRQVFFKCDYLEKWRSIVDKIVEEFRQYKSNVPTYGVIMLDPTLNYILLVQGYYASRNSWGFPKGKINEGELPMECAIREAFEEVGFDSKDNITNKIRPLQCFIGETLVGLYIAVDVPMDYPFKPHLRKEIRKISWFSVWDLPRDRNDDKSCARLGLQPNNFYSVLPFINKICDFILKEQAERAKGPKCSALKQEGGSSESSAFQPVIPRATSQQKIFNPTPNTSLQDLHQLSTTDINISSTDIEPSTSSSKSAVENLFKPLNVELENQVISFTGQGFLEQFVKMSSPASAVTTSSFKEQQIPKNPAGVIGAESRRRNKDIKQPKPLHPSKLILNVYEAPPEQQKSSSESPQKKIKTLVTTTTPETMMTDIADGENATGGNEIVNMLRSSIRKEPPETATLTTIASLIAESSQMQSEKKAQLPASVKVHQQLVPTQVRLCEAWKKFTFDRSRLQQLHLYASY